MSKKRVRLVMANTVKGVKVWGNEFETCAWTSEEPRRTL